MGIYLDNAATTVVRKDVVDEMSRVMLESFGNPSSKHKLGVDARMILKNSREIIAATLNAKPKEIVFTSGGTEANNQAIITAADCMKRAGMHVITTQTEHSSVLKPMEELERRGFEVTYLPVNKNGQVEPDTLKDAIREDTVLCSIMLVNNEIGAINDIKALGNVIKNENNNRDKNHKIIFHVDAIQAYGKMKINPAAAGVDLLSVSGHKFHGPKGSGFLYVKDGTKVKPYIYGGGQERVMRSGTENVPAIAGLSVAVKYAYDNLNAISEKMYSVKEHLVEQLHTIEDVKINGLDGISLKETAPHILSASFKGIRSEVLLNALSDKGIFVSSGSACSSNRPELSGTLKAIGVADDMLDSTIRFSFCDETTIEETDELVKALNELLPMLRMFTRR